MNQALLHQLRISIAQKVDLVEVTPADCFSISLAIRKELKKNISVTTLKRLYGFAMMRNDFSEYTISTLKEFAGFEEF